VLIAPEQGMGEGSHIYKLRGRYYIVSAIPGAHVPMKCARADRIEGPWEVKTISENESLGIGQSYRLRNTRQQGPPFEITPPNPAESASLTLHQGGIIDTVTGEWWGFSMQDHNSVGRLTSLSPVTWVDGWPYFGLPGNLTRTPKTWVKPNTGHVERVSSPYKRSDDFNRPALQAVWQWNHIPDDTNWSLTERPGFLRLHSLPARDFWRARNSVTQRAIGPESTATTDLDVSGLQPGDVAGLALLNLPYAWTGVRRSGDGFALAYFDQTTGESRNEKLDAPRLKLRVHCNFDVDTARFSYSIAGREFKPIGGELKLPFQLKTFQGVRYALFHYNENGAPGGQADFDAFVVSEPRPRGLTKPIPYNRAVTFADLANGNVLAVIDGEVRSVAEKDRGTAFRIVDRGLGRIALQTASGAYVSVAGSGRAGDVKAIRTEPGDAETFQWVDLQRGDTLLLSLATHRYIAAPPGSGPVGADDVGPSANRKDGSCFEWRIVR
jgi:xylan 1,4-beta-xylosidase